MLRKLYIKNFALIKEVHFEPKMGLNIITGETGAGKSIMFDALGLALGKRADGLSLFDDTQKCIIEAHFSISDNLLSLFDQKDLDYDGHTIFRREISPSGKSRLFINDTPASLADAKEIGSFLIDIHNQHESLTIFKPKNLLLMLDSIAASPELVSDFKTKFLECRLIQTQIDNLKEKYAEFEKKKDYNEFLFKELEQLNLTAEDANLEVELNKLSNAEEIKNLGVKIANALGGEEVSALSIMEQLQAEVNKLSILASQDSCNQRYKSVLLELKDIILEMEGIVEETDLNNQRLSEVQERFNAIQGLFSKHNARTVAELINVLEILRSSLAGNSNMEKEISQLELSLSENRKVLEDLSMKLTQKRKAAIGKIEPMILHDLRELELNNAQLDFRMEQGELSETGADQVALYFSANKNMDLKQVGQSASGGELSRLALVIKSLVTGGIPTLVFDEIDTGVSGKVAQKVGSLLKNLGHNKQIISITHSPQVSAAADYHYFVSKQEEKGKIYTMIAQLSTKSRVEAIAQMLSGDKITPEAKKNAESLLLTASK